ncbi:MAG: HTTM domain-containing protein [Planctomycetaceae bacterium]
MQSPLELGAPKRLIDHVREFFYAERTPYGLALIRIFLPWVMLIDGGPRLFQVRELYSSDGATAPLWEAYGSAPFVPTFPAPVAVAGYAALIFLLLAASAGWLTRLSLISATVLYMYFIPLDMISTLNKYTVLSGHVMFLLSVSQCGSVWSVDAWLARRRTGAPLQRPRFAVWPQRLIQLLICIVYLAAAFTKMHTPSFFSGDQLVFWMLTDTTASNPLGDWMSMYPALAPVTGYLTVIWEVAFIFVSWRGVGRTCMLSVGLVFHALTFFMLGLIVFPLLYCVLYLSWLHESDVERLAAWWRRRTGRTIDAEPTACEAGPSRWAAWFGPAPSAALFATLLAATAVTAVELDHRADLYGERRPEGRYALEKLSPARARELLRSDTRLRSHDKMFAFNIGSTVIGGILANRRDTFEYNEPVVVQCSLIWPHEDMWIEFNLHDAEGRIISRNGQFAPREFFRVSHTHTFGEGLPPGDYQWVLRYDGLDIARRPFRLGGEDIPPAAPTTAAVIP